MKFEEKILKPKSGFFGITLGVLGILASICILLIGAVMWNPIIKTVVMVFGSILMVVSIILFCGLKTVNPNEAMVLTLFGKYYGTIVDDGFFFVNPFATIFNPTADSQTELATDELLALGSKGRKQAHSVVKTKSKKVSTKTNTLNNAQQKVNDVSGNPIIIGAVVIWKIENATKAVFNVENYYDYLSTQCDSIIRNTARLYPYDVLNHEDDEMTLRGSTLEIANKMKQDLQAKVYDAGIQIIDVKITHLAYSEEIAAAMLRRQQATATIAAKEKIVEGAVGMVKMAIEMLDEDEMICLDDERKAAMVSNLLVVLCGDKDAQPVVNSGTIY